MDATRRRLGLHLPMDGVRFMCAWDAEPASVRALAADIRSVMLELQDKGNAA